MQHHELVAAIGQLHEATAIYTAEPIVDRLLDAINWPYGGKRLLDPSAGDGALLGRALERLLEAFDLSVEEAAEQIRGWEIHAGACQSARERVSSIFMHAGAPWEQALKLAEQIVRHGDYLSDAEGEFANVIISNPPYIRWLKVPSVLRQRYEPIVPDFAMGDLMHSFLEKSVRTLAPGGSIGLVVADRVLSNINASRLRLEMGRQVAISKIERLSVASAFYRAKTRRSGTLPRVHPVMMVLVPKDSKEARIQLTDEPIYIDGEEPARESVTTLNDVASVLMAPWIGKGVFQVSKEVADRLPPNSIVPAAESADLAGGSYCPGKWYAIKTRPGQEPPEAVREHLLRERSRLAQRGRRKNPWLPPETFHAWDLSVPYLVIPRVARTLTPRLLPAGVLPLNHALCIPITSDALHELVVRNLCSEATEKWLSNRAARLENGFFQVSARLLRSMPIWRAGSD